MLSHPDWLSRLQAAGSSGTVDDASLLRAFGRRISDEIRRGHSGAALRWTVAGLLRARRKAHLVSDALRPSTVPSAERKLVFLLEELATISKSVPGLDCHRHAIGSWHAFASMFLEARPERTTLQAILARSPHRSARMALSLVEELAASETRPVESRTGAPVHFRELDFEHACSAASFILATLARMQRLGFDEKPRPAVDRALGEDCLLSAFWLHELLEQELLVFRMGYRCSRVGSFYRLEAPDDSVGFAISHGYYLTNQIPITRARARFTGGVRLSALAKSFMAAVRDDSPYKLSLSDGRAHFQYLLREGHVAFATKLINQEQPYEDEMHELWIACSNLKVDFDRLLSFQIADGLSIRDVLHVQRLMKFLAITRQNELKHADLTESERLEAQLLMMRRSDFAKIGATLGLPEPILDRFLDCFSWSAAEGEWLDIQYTPVLRIGDIVTIPLFTASYSNLIRNGLMLHNRRFFEDGTIDPLSDDLKTAFEESGHRVWTNLKFSWQGKQWEIDALAIVGSTLLAIEAKNTLLPCSSREMRTTWNHLEKAAEQLDRVRLAFRAPELQIHLEQRLGISLAEFNLSTCIVTSHWVASGIEFAGHPLRSCDELCNFVANGGGHLWIGLKECPIRFRTTGPLTSQDLAQYLGTDNPVSKRIWSGGFKRSRRVVVGKAHIEIVEYAFSLEVALARSGLCSPSTQSRLDEALSRLEKSEAQEDHPSEAAASMLADMRSAYETALDELERSLPEAPAASDDVGPSS